MDKECTISSTKSAMNSNEVIKTVIQFLQMFMTETLAKRLISMVLVAVGIPDTLITEATGMCNRSVRTLKKAINNGELDELFVVGHGSGRNSNAKGFEDSISKELETNNYHTRQQVADMILEKYGVSMSVSAVGRLLKKTATSD